MADPKYEISYEKGEFYSWFSNQKFADDLLDFCKRNKLPVNFKTGEGFNTYFRGYSPQDDVSYNMTYPFDLRKGQRNDANIQASNRYICAQLEECARNPHKALMYFPETKTAKGIDVYPHILYYDNNDTKGLLKFTQNTVDRDTRSKEVPPYPERPAAPIKPEQEPEMPEFSSRLRYLIANPPQDPGKFTEEQPPSPGVKPVFNRRAPKEPENKVFDLPPKPQNPGKKPRLGFGIWFRRLFNKDAYKNEYDEYKTRLDTYNDLTKQNKEYKAKEKQYKKDTKKYEKEYKRYEQEKADYKAAEETHNAAVEAYNQKMVIYNDKLAAFLERSNEHQNKLARYQNQTEDLERLLKQEDYDAKMRSYTEQKNYYDDYPNAMQRYNEALKKFEEDQKVYFDTKAFNERSGHISRSMSSIQSQLDDELFTVKQGKSMAQDQYEAEFGRAEYQKYRERVLAAEQKGYSNDERLLDESDKLKDTLDELFKDCESENAKAVFGTINRMDYITVDKIPIKVFVASAFEKQVQKLQGYGQKDGVLFYHDPNPIHPNADGTDEFGVNFSYPNARHEAFKKYAYDENGNLTEDCKALCTTVLKQHLLAGAQVEIHAPNEHMQLPEHPTYLNIREDINPNDTLSASYQNLTARQKFMSHGENGEHEYAIKLGNTERNDKIRKMQEKATAHYLETHDNLKKLSASEYDTVKKDLIVTNISSDWIKSKVSESDPTVFEQDKKQTMEMADKLGHSIDFYFHKTEDALAETLYAPKFDRNSFVFIQGQPLAYWVEKYKESPDPGHDVTIPNHVPLNELKSKEDERDAAIGKMLIGRAATRGLNITAYAPNEELTGCIKPETVSRQYSLFDYKIRDANISAEENANRFDFDPEMNPELKKKNPEFQRSESLLEGKKKEKVYESHALEERGEMQKKYRIAKEKASPNVFVMTSSVMEKLDNCFKTTETILEERYQSKDILRSDYIMINGKRLTERLREHFVEEAKQKYYKDTHEKDLKPLKEAFEAADEAVDATAALLRAEENKLEKEEAALSEKTKLQQAAKKTMNAFFGKNKSEATANYNRLTKEIETTTGTIETAKKNIVEIKKTLENAKLTRDTAENNVKACEDGLDLALGIVEKNAATGWKEPSNFEIAHAVLNAVLLDYHVDVFAPNQDLEIPKIPVTFSKDAKEYDAASVTKSEYFEETAKKYNERKLPLPKNYQDGKWLDHAKKDAQPVAEAIEKQNKKTSYSYLAPESQVSMRLS